jgi:hypothetical protein
MSHFTYQMALKKATVMVDWETMMQGALIAHRMPCPLAILKRSTLIMRHQTIALKEMGTLILNLVSDSFLVPQNKWVYGTCISEYHSFNNMDRFIMLL